MQRSIRQVFASRAHVRGCALALVALVTGAVQVRAQTHSHPLSPEDVNSELHMFMTPARGGTVADSARAAGVAALLRDALTPFADTNAAVAAGFKMFNPKNKNQKQFHFTSNMNALKEAFRFDPAKPTSLLYRKDATGRLVLTGAMYTAPKGFSPDKLDTRVPLSVARWHKHVNWCMPRKGETARWSERKDGQMLFGPASSIATKSACDAIGGDFHDTVFGWMVHANVMSGDDPAKIWGDDHGHDMHAGMKMGDMKMPTDH